ncbi:MAG: phenylalanine--tRNA ligase subunit beta [Nitriliruptoraceae bacterium]|nr:phenylalanine--tRNA ligase subunit beta [Nitriliruptoraceae bacterium]
MKLPLSWLTSMVDLDLSTDELTELMSLRGLEVEEVTTPGLGTSGVRTARVLHHEPHPDADKLRFVKVTGEGGEGEIELVCGASNFEVGDIVAHATVGGHVPGVTGPDGTRGLTMAAREIRGVVSNGMIASARELELGEDHDGILVLPPDTPLGVELTELLPVGEPVVEIAVQADRGDHLGVLGVARDLAAILDTGWRAPIVPDVVAAPTLPVTLDTDGCASFHTWVIEDVEVVDSPPWVRQRLAQCGIRSIDVVVDVTNLVMLELGQPLHAFDLDQLHGPSLTVRAARAGERLTTLDDTERTLVEGDLVIEDADRLVSLAGVMGGADTEVTRATRRVLIEAAVWDPAAIRATSRRLGLVSEASKRYERAVDPQGAARAAARAAGLIAQLAGGRLIGTDAVVRDPAPAWAVRPPVELDAARTAAFLALKLDADAQAALLRRAGCEVEVAGDTLAVQPPSWRRDLARPADLAEEIARLHGYEHVPTTLPRLDVTGGLTPAQRAEREARSIAVAAGFHEAVTRPFVGDEALVGLVPTAGRVRLANPLAQDASAMRPSLVEGLIQAVRRNHGQGRPGVGLVELGRLFRPVDDPLATVLDAVVDGDWRWRSPAGDDLPIQPRVLALAAGGVQLGHGWLDARRRWDVHDLLATIDEVVRRLAPHEQGAALERVAVTREGFHPYRTVSLRRDGHEIGLVGQLHPTVCEARDLPQATVVAELLLEPLLAATPDTGHPPVPAEPLVKHPAMTIDVALAADDGVPHTALEAAARAGAGDLLDALWTFDVYRGAQLGEGQRSVAMRLRLQDPDRQLTDADAEVVIDAVAAEAERIGAVLRR